MTESEKYYSESEDSDYDMSDEDQFELDDYADEEADYDEEDDFLINSDKILNPPPKAIGEWHTEPQFLGENFLFHQENVDMGKLTEKSYFTAFFTPDITRQ
uniref:Uncharacterized protein n=1 Tax=Acrobeloides nanus TaxID=290746 RepID=A0A914CU10_9BILA